MELTNEELLHYATSFERHCATKTEEVLKSDLRLRTNGISVQVMSYFGSCDTRSHVHMLSSAEARSMGQRLIEMSNFIDEHGMRIGKILKSL